MNLKDKYFPVLDHGFVALKDIMGSDEDIEQAARVSYGKGTRKKSETRGLIRYLLRHKHTSPFEMCELKFHVRVPMDCWRQWIRHRTASVNEYSTRYSESLNFNEVPIEWRAQASSNKQGSDSIVNLPHTTITRVWEILGETKRLYRSLIGAGVAREQARTILPLNTYTEAYWKIDLHNLLHFLRLRCDSHAQLEIRSYANVIAGIVKECYPITFEAWEDYVFGAVTFSRQEMMVLHAVLCQQIELDILNIKKACESLQMSKRETTEFLDKIDKVPTLFNIDLPEDKPYSYFQEEQHEKNNKVAKPTH